MQPVFFNHDRVKATDTVKKIIKDNIKNKIDKNYYAAGTQNLSILHNIL